MTETGQPRYRYPGVTPFTTAQKMLFMGRDKDIEAFYQLLFVKQLVILYGKSGYGKSSLINAGIIPKLDAAKDNKGSYFQVRLYTQDKEGFESGVYKTPLERLIKHLSNGVEELPFMEPLRENALWYWVKQHQFYHKNAPVIFFFDQFEELFTYSNQEVEDFASQLGLLLYQTIPEGVSNLIEKELYDKLTDEEVDFLYDKPNVKVVFSIRSDRMSLLNRLTKCLPNLLQYHYELDAITEDDARLAIIQPAKMVSTEFLSPCFEYDEQVVDAIIARVKNTFDGKIETAALQIICRFIEEQKVLAKRINLIDEKNLGNITTIFKDYYQSALDKLALADRAKVRNMIEDKFIQNSQRIPFEGSYIQKEYQLDERILEQLEQSTLLRKERDSYGRFIYEIGHDTLIEPILEFATIRNIEGKRKKTRRRISLISGALVVLCVVLGFMTWLWLNAKQASEEATRNLDYFYLQKVKEFSDNADAMRRNGGYEPALAYYDSSLVFLDTIKTHDSLVYQLRSQVKSNINQLKK